MTHLMQDHAELGELLDQLIAKLESNDSLEANELARIYATLDLFWARLAMHIRAEHLHLFEAILRAVNLVSTPPAADMPTPADAAKTIEELREDHNFFMRELSQAVAVMRELSVKPKADVAEQLQNVCNRIHSVEQRLRKHNAIEENGIYLWTSRLLTQAEQSELGALVDKELANTPPRFGVN